MGLRRGPLVGKIGISGEFVWRIRKRVDKSPRTTDYLNITLLVILVCGGKTLAVLGFWTATPTEICQRIRRVQGMSHMVHSLSSSSMVVMSRHLSMSPAITMRKSMMHQNATPPFNRVTSRLGDITGRTHNKPHHLLAHISESQPYRPLLTAGFRIAAFGRRSCCCSCC